MKEKLHLIQAIAKLQAIDEFEQQAETNPIIESYIDRLQSGDRLIAMDYIKNLKDRGLIVPDPVPSKEEFKKANPQALFILSRSAEYQMTLEEYRTFRQSGLKQSTKVAIYPDISTDSSVVHYRYFNSNGTQHSTGANQEMVRVSYRDLDPDESVMNYGLVIEANSYYETAKNEIQDLLRNIESIKNGTYSSQAL